MFAAIIVLAVAIPVSWVIVRLTFPALFRADPASRQKDQPHD